MSSKISVGIDIGTSRVKVAVAETVRLENGADAPRIIGLGSAEAKGMRHGYVIHAADASRAVRAAVEQAERSAGIKIRKAYLSIGGIGLGSLVGKGTAMVSKGDAEVTQLDIKNVLDAAESELAPSVFANKKVVFTIPLSYKIDGEPVLGRPLAMHGAKLEAKVLFIVCLDQHLNDLIKAVEDAGVDVIDVMAAPIAASLAVMTKNQKVAGGVLVNIGAETVSAAVFENNIPVSLEIFPGGSADITNDIALGLRIPIDEAEKIKTGGVTGASYPKKKLDDLVGRRLDAIFAAVESHLKKIGRDGLLPAGAILSGGGAAIAGIDEAARDALRLPAKIAVPAINPAIKHSLADSAWSVACGLALWGLESGDGSDEITVSSARNGTFFKKAADWFKQFLP